MVILRPTARDKFGDPVDPSNAFTPIPENNWIIAPGSGNDDQDGLRNKSEDFATAYAIDGTVARHPDHVMIDGTEWLVAANPARWESPFSGFKPGSVVPLERYSG